MRRKNRRIGCLSDSVNLAMAHINGIFDKMYENVPLYAVKTFPQKPFKLLSGRKNRTIAFFKPLKMFDQIH